MGEHLLGFGLAIALPWFAWAVTEDWRIRGGLIVISLILLLATFRTCTNPPLLTLDAAGVLTLRCRPFTLLGCLIPPQQLRLAASEIERVSILQPKSGFKALRSPYAWTFESSSFLCVAVFMLWRRGNAQPYYQRLFGIATNQSEMLAALQQRGVKVSYE